jgi:hypothetical protein
MVLNIEKPTNLPSCAAKNPAGRIELIRRCIRFIYLLCLLCRWLFSAHQVFRRTGREVIALGFKHNSKTYFSRRRLTYCNSRYLSWNRPDSSWPNVRPCSTIFTSTLLTSCAYAYLMYITSCIYSIFSYAVVDALSTADITSVSWSLSKYA